MSKNKYKNRNQGRIEGGWVAITFEMMDSAAFRELTESALKSLIYAMRKVKTYNNRFEQIFELTYCEARKSGLHDSAFARGMEKLQQVGFIDCVEKGGLRCDHKTPTKYRLSQRWKAYRTPKFEEHHKGYSEAIHGR